MRTLTLAFVVAAAVAASVPLSARQGCARAAATPRALQPGDMAPDLVLPGTDGRTYRLADYRGKQAVVLVWFARAFSAG